MQHQSEPRQETKFICLLGHAESHRGYLQGFFENFRSTVLRQGRFGAKLPGCFFPHLKDRDEMI